MEKGLEISRVGREVESTSFLAKVLREEIVVGSLGLVTVPFMSSFLAKFSGK